MEVGSPSSLAPRPSVLRPGAPEAVRAHILELTTEQAKAANADVDESNLTAIVRELLDQTGKQ